MRNLGKKTTLLENIVLLSSSEKIYEIERNVKCLYGVPEVEEKNKMSILTNIVMASIIILIGLFVLIFGEKLKIRKKTRILIYAILIFMPLIINSIYSLSVGAMSAEFFGWRIDVNIIIALIIILVGLLVSILNIKRETKILIIIPLILILIPIIIAIISSLL